MTRRTGTLDLNDLAAHDAFLRALARRLARDEASAADLAQETWLQALRQRPDPTRPIRAWLTTVARRTAAHAVRRDQRRTERERAIVEDQSWPTPHQLLERSEAARRLITALTELPEPYRSALLLRYQEGRSTDEIARRSGVAAGTVRWRLAEGRRLLRERLEPDPNRRRELLRAMVIGPIQTATPWTAGVSLLFAKLLVVPFSVALLAAAFALLSGAVVPWSESPSAPAADAPLEPAGPAHRFERESLKAPGAAPSRVAADDSASLVESATVRGVVLDRSGAPIAGAWVRRLEEVYDEESMRRWPSSDVVFTADDGTFLTAVREDDDDPAWIAGRDGYASSTVHHESEDGSVEFRLATSATVYGTIYEFGTRRPVAGVHLEFGVSDDFLQGLPRDPPFNEIGSCQWRGDGPQEVITGADGTYRFDGLPVGEEVLVVLRREGHGEQERLAIHPGGEPLRLDFALARGVDFSLIVVDAESGAPIAGATLDTGVSKRSSDDRGRFECRGLVGEWPYLEMVAPGYCRTLVQRERGELDGVVLSVPLLRSETLVGTLLDEDGDPLAERPIHVSQKGESERLSERLADVPIGVTIHPAPSSWVAWTDVDGRFDIRGLIPGFAPVVLCVDFDSGSLAQAVPVERGAGDRPIVVRMPRSATVRGRVTNGGRPVRAGVWFITAELGRGAASTAADGSFTMTAGPGVGLLRVQPDSDGAAFLPHVQSLSLAPGEHRPMDIELGFVDHQVAGRVVDSAGRPAVGSYVVLPGAGQWQVDEDGRFDIRFLGQAQEAWPLEVEMFPRFVEAGAIASGAEDVEITLPESVTARIRVLDDATGQPVPRFLVPWEHAVVKERYSGGSEYAQAQPDGVAAVSLPRGECVISIDATLFGYPVSGPHRIDVHPGAATFEIRLRR